MTTQDHVDIQVNNLEAELRKLGQGQEQKNQVRACLFNLIIFSQDQRKAAYLHQIVKNILERFPCRIIFIQEFQNSSQEYLRAFASAVTITQGETNIVCDQINIDCTTAQLERVPFVLLPLLVPDLPLYLVWGQKATTDTEILPHLTKYASRFIFDPDCTDNLQEFCQRIIHILSSSQIEVRDVRWAALGGWRSVLSQVFDSPHKIEQLRLSRHIQILFNKHESIFGLHTQLQALYLQAWIAAQMGWAFSKTSKINDALQFTYEYQGHQITIDLVPKDISNLPPGEIVSFEASSFDNYSFLLIRNEKLPFVTAHIATRETCEIPTNYVLNEIKNAPNMMREIFYRKTGQHYYNMLHMIAQTNGI